MAMVKPPKLVTLSPARAAEILRPLALAARPPRKPAVAEWAEKTVRFDTALDASPRYVLAKSPYASFVFDAWIDPEVEEIFLLWPTQAGKTACMAVLMCYLIENDPGPVIFVQSDEKPTKAYVRFRLKPTIKVTFPGLVSESERDADWSDSYGAFIGGTHIWPAWSTSESRCRSWPRRYIFGDETSIWKTSRRFILERTKQFLRNRKALWATTPTVEEEQSWFDANEIFKLYRWGVPCPHCGVIQVLDFRRLRFEQCKEGAEWNLDRVERETTYECEHCNKEIAENQRSRIINKGSPVVDPASQNRSRKQVSLRVTALDVPGIPWGLTARTWLESLGNTDNLKAYVNGWLVEPWREKGHGLKGANVLGRVMEMAPGTCPANTDILLGGIDVQHGHVFVVIRAFLTDGRSVLLYCARVEGENGSTWSALDKCFKTVLNKSYRWEGHPEEKRAVLSFVDSGDGQTVKEVYRFAVEHRTRVWCVKGTETAGTPWSLSHVDKYPDGKPIPGGIRLYRVATKHFREVVVGSFLAAEGERGAWLVCPNTPKEYGDHLEAWQVERHKTRNGGIINRWIQRRNHDHYLDCEIYTATLYDILKFVPRKPGQVRKLPSMDQEVVIMGDDPTLG